LAAISIVKHIATIAPNAVGVRYGTTFVHHVLHKMKLPKRLGLMITQESYINCIELKNMRFYCQNSQQYLDQCWDVTEAGFYEEAFPFITSDCFCCRIYFSWDGFLQI
jgi:hypothetical protein